MENYFWQLGYMDNMRKNFLEWNELKHGIDADGNIPTFQEREIWWCRIGLNIGHEMDGKGAQYSRPVLVVRKFNERIFFGVPMTTKIKDSPYYHRITFRGKEQCAILSQLRLWEARRFTSKMGKLSPSHFKILIEEIKNTIG